MTDAPISPLRRRMIEDMTVRKFAARTQEGYIRAVKGFRVFLGASPATASAGDLRRYRLMVESGVGAPTSLYSRGVVGDVNDALERHAKPFGDELRETRLVALSRGHRAHHQLDPAFGKHGDLRALARGATGDLDIVGDETPSKFTLPCRL